MILSVIIPVYNDQEVLPELQKRLFPVLDSLEMQKEIVFVEDGSSDDSFRILQKIQAAEENVKIIKLRRNSGQLNAVRAGLQNVKGDLILLMDSDLQDRPEDIPVLLEHLEEYEADMAVARWIFRKGESVRNILSRSFFKIANFLCGIEASPDLGMFRVMKNKLLGVMQEVSGKPVSELGYLYKAKVKYVPVDLERDERSSGKSGYNSAKLMKLAWQRLALCPLFRILVKKQPQPGYEIEKIFEN